MAQTTDTVPAVEVPQDKTQMSQLLWQGGTIIALVGLIVVFGVLRPAAFLSFGNMTNILAQVAILTIIAAAQTVVMVTGHFDLSVGTTATLAGATASALMIRLANGPRCFCRISTTS